MRPIISIIDPPSPCEYLPQETWQIRRELYRTLAPDAYLRRLQEGWRRFGPMVFRPECPACRKCVSLRVPTATFRPSASQRRAWTRNQGEVTLRIGPAVGSAEALHLFQRFHRWKHASQGWPEAEGEDLDVFVENPFATEEWRYSVDDRLIGVGYVDALPGALSAIYFFYEPEERHRSLGTFNVLSMLQVAAERGMQYVYLGYYVQGCRSLEYKARFRPHETLQPDGRWA